jgi:ABC-type transport system substrate-binding protein
MRKAVFLFFAILAYLPFNLGMILPIPCFGQDWAHRVKPRGSLAVVDLFQVPISVMLNYAEGLVTVDTDNKFVPCLAQDWRWVNDRTIEFKLREGVRFQNGEKFNAEALRINWEDYRRLECPRLTAVSNLPDETIFEIIDEYRVRFTFPEPDGLALVKFRWFFQIAPEFFKEHRIPENSWLYLTEPGPWCTGPFKLVEGSAAYGKLTLVQIRSHLRSNLDSIHRCNRFLRDSGIAGKGL